MVVTKSVDTLLRRKKLLGLLFLAVGVLLWINGYDFTQGLDGANLSVVTFVLLILGIVFLAVGLRRHERHA